MKVCFVGAAGCGKAQPYYSKILTPSGWTTFEDVVPGQQICCPDGTTALVKSIFDRDIRPVYRVTFADNRSMDCCDEHLFKVRSSSWNREWHLMTCAEIAKQLAWQDISVPFTLPPSLRFQRNQQHTPIPPYIMGVLLGNGGLTTDIRFTSHDVEIKTRVEMLLDERLHLSERGEHAWSIVRKTKSNTDALSWRNYLTKVGLFGLKSHEKFVPDDYKFLTTEERTDLLQGLLDTDGTVSSEGAISFTTASVRLRDDLIFLVRSLGGRASWTSKIPTYAYLGEKRTGLEAFTVFVNYRDPKALFSLSRKRDRLRDKGIRHEILSIKSIEYVADLPVRCILIDHPDRLYITDDFIVTHNTTLATSVFTALKQAGRQAEHVHEFVRYDIHAHGPMTSIWEQYRTRQFQKELEDAVPNDVDYVICDSGTLSPYFYASLYADASEPRQRLVLQDMYRYFITDLFTRRYDLVFYLPSFDHPNLNDGTRYQTENEIKILDEHMRLVFTKLHRLDNVHMVQSGLDLRLEEVMWKILGTDNLTLKLHSDKFAFSWRAEQN